MDLSASTRHELVRATPSNPVVKAIVVDRYPLFVHAIANILRELQPNIEVVGAHSGEDGKRACTEYLGDLALVVLDWNIQGATGRPILDAIRKLDPSIPVVVTSASGNEALMADILRWGATSIISRSSTPAAISKVMRGVISEKLISLPACIATNEGIQAFRFTEDHQRRIGGVGLSLRESQVLELVVAGHSNKSIARKLDIAECTVKAHLTSIFRALNVTNRTQAVYKITHG
jgi:DNA-binding NarL/FixJ family response regulator